MKSTNKYFFYDIKKNDEINIFNIIEKDFKIKKMVLDKDKFLTITKKHIKIFKNEKTVEIIRNKIPEIIKKAYEQNGVWVNLKNNDYIFLAEYKFNKKRISPICIPLHFNEKNGFLSVKSFYIVRNLQKKKKIFNSRYKWNQFLKNENFKEEKMAMV